MKKNILLIMTIGIAIFLSACAQKVTIKALKPAEIDRVASTKKISVAPFRNDNIGLGTKIEAHLANHRIDDENYFTIVSRSDFDRIIKEQKIQNSGLVDQKMAVEVGNLIGAQAIISGDVSRPTLSDTRYYEERYRCADKKCKTFVVYRVRCTKRVINLGAEVRIVDVSHGDVIHAKSFQKSSVYNHCSDDSRTLPSREMAAQRLAAVIADEFTYKLLPHYRTFEVTLLEKPDLDYDDRQEKLLKVSIEYIKQSRYDKAQQFLFELVDSTGEQSYVAFYNLGVLKEAEGNYKDAQEYYKTADDLMVEPVEEISQAYLRIKSLMKERERANAQLSRGR